MKMYHKAFKKLLAFWEKNSWNRVWINNESVIYYTKWSR